MGADALNRLATSPLGMGSFQSAFLALVGFLLFGVASWKWLQRDDPYPDYGRRDRQAKAVEKRYVDASTKARKALTEVFDRHMAKFDDDYHQTVAKAPKWFEVSTRAQTVIDNYGIHLAQYDHDMDYLLQAYRTANRNARAEPAPQYFTVEKHVDEDVVAPPSFEPPPESDLTPLFDSLHRAKTSLQKRREEAMNSIRPLEDLQRVEAAP